MTPVVIRTLGSRALRFFAAILIAVACASPVIAQNSLTVSDLTLDTLGEVPGTVLLSTDAPAQSVFLSLTFDGAVLTAGTIQSTGVAIAAEGVFPNLFQSAGGLIVGLIMDVSPPFAGQTMPIGVDQPILTIGWSIGGAVPTAPTTTSIGFVDGVFDSPPVTNTITQAGVGAITAANGLSLVPGTVTIEPPLPATFRILSTSILAGAETPVPVRLDNRTGPIEAFFLALEVPAALTVTDFDIVGTILETVGVEFLTADLSTATITFDGVVDADPPFDGQTIPLGTDLPFLFLTTTCPAPPIEPDPALAVDLAGSPSLPTEVTSGGLVLAANTVAGTITCLPAPLGAATFFGGRLDSSGNVVAISSSPGEIIEYGFFYTDPTDGIEGLQIASCLDCDEAFFIPGSFTAIGDALDEAEFVQPNYEQDPFDGDGCEFVLGVLLDSVPPFDGAVLPLTDTPLRLGTVEIAIDPSVPVGASITVGFCNGINGSGAASVNNLVVVGGASIETFTKIDGTIVLDATPPFLRGDVNHDGGFNVADPVATLGYLFAGGDTPECLAAADIDASGTILLNDPILALDYLFVAGPPPVAPFPDCGTSTGEACDIGGPCP